MSTATVDDCAAFQRKALALPRNWRSKHPRSKEEQSTLSPSTVVKWTVALTAAFERVNRSAGRKCVRGVVPDSKLLPGNPWKDFRGVEGTTRAIRRFDAGDLISFLDYLHSRWSAVTVAAAVAKVFLWSASRKEEIAGLTWDQYRSFQGEHHFDVEGKWGVRKWFRVPDGLYRELAALRVEGNPYVFAAYNGQLRQHYQGSKRPGTAKVVGTEFSPVCLGDWFYERLKEWKGDAYIHLFRKTALQFARAGEDVNRQVAEDARVSENVMLGHYVTEEDDQLRARSNRTYARLAAALPSEVAARYGQVRPTPSSLEERIQSAQATQDWDLVASLAAELARGQRSSAG